MSNKSKRHRQGKPTEAKQKPAETHMHKFETRINRSIEVDPSQDSNKLHATERQEDTAKKREEHSVATRSLRIATFALVVSTLYFIATCLIYWQTKKAADAAKSAAETAHQALTDTRTNFIVEQRPIMWLSNEIGFPKLIASPSDPTLGQFLWS
jgi:hypothetical protein